MNSPITHKQNVELLDHIPASQIIELYKKNIRIDVSRFFEKLDQVSIYRCKDSDFRFYYPPQVAGDAKFYTDLQEVMPYYLKWRWEHSVASSYIKKGMKVLEVGCGFGFFMEKLTNRGIDCVGLEFNEEAVSAAQKKSLKVVNEFVEDHAVLNEGEYDVVCFFQVLEHISDVKSFLEGSIKCLKKGGCLIIGVPHNNPYLYKYDRLHTLNLPPHHMGLWDKKAFEKLSEFFSIEKETIRIEPLQQIKHQIRIWLEFKKYPMLSNIVKRIPEILFKGLALLAGRFFEGRNIIAVYRKL